jgi:alpha-1,3-mannosyltransferase
MEDTALNLARRQRAEYGLDARVVTLDRLFTHQAERLPKNALIDGVPVTRLSWRGSTRYPIAPGVLSHVMRADIIHVHAIDFFFDFLALTKLVHRKPMLVLTQGGFFHTPYRAALKRVWFSTITRMSLSAYNAVVAGSENDAKLFSTLRPKNLVTIENGADVTKLSRDKPLLRAPRRILSIGRFAPHKRISVLFDLLAALRRISPDWEIVVAGVAWGQTEAELRAQAAAAGVDQSVRFIVGASDAELAEEAASATWFGCASAFEGFGIAAVEAAAVGLIPILSKIPTFERLVGVLGAGILFDPADVDSAANEVSRLEQTIETDGEAIRAGLSKAAEVYDWSGVTARYVALYSKIMDQRSSDAVRQFAHRT